MHHSARERETRRVVVVAYDDAELLEVASITSTLATANDLLSRGEAYETTVATPGGTAVRCSSGLSLGSQAALEKIRGPLDTLVVSGGRGHLRAADDPHLVAHVRRLARESRRVASVCSGSSVLAARPSSNVTESRPPATVPPTVTDRDRPRAARRGGDVVVVTSGGFSPVGGQRGSVLWKGRHSGPEQRPEECDDTTFGWTFRRRATLRSRPLWRREPGA